VGDSERVDTTNVTCLKANSYENAHANTGKMPALPAISRFVVANLAMGVGMRCTNVNRLTKTSNRDPITATPLHRFVPCRKRRRDS